MFTPPLDGAKLPRRLVGLRRVLSFAVALSINVLLTGCDKPSACEKHKAEVESCDRVYKVDICGTPQGRCAVACFSKASCDELDAFDEGASFPAWLEQCLTPCGEEFTCDDGHTIQDWWRCDGTADCADGSDERACKYFECKSGQRVRATAKCDGYAHCSDGSDEPEESCSYEE